MYFLFLTLSLSIAKNADAQYSYIGTYNFEGTPNYLLTPRDPISVAFKNSVEATLPEYRPVPIYNPNYLSSTKPETINLRDSADVWITFVDEGAIYRNSLGYYTFNIDAPLTSPPSNSQIKIIFPNASKGGFGGGLTAGDKVYLGKFPPRTGIGFVLIADGWNGTEVTNGKWKIFSNARFNPEDSVSLKKHVVLIDDTLSEKILMGFEDIRRDTITDNDFNDLVVYASVIPKNSIIDRDSFPPTFLVGDSVYTGNSGGLESKSLGDIIAQRTLQQYKNGLHTSVHYQNASLLQNIDVATQQTNQIQSTQNVRLENIMPTKVYDAGYVVYVTTPTDLTNFTNAVEVRSIDFTQQKKCKAVAFATKTVGSVYTHTKAICDRLREGKLLHIEDFTLKGLKFVRYTIQKENNVIEYATSFTIGTKAGRPTFSFQSNWLTKYFVNEDEMYNFQLWANAPHLVTDLILEVLKKVEAIAPIETIGSFHALPSVFIIEGKRVKENLVLKIRNRTNQTQAVFEVDERLNELSNKETKIITANIAANGVSVVTIPIKDAYENDLRLLTNNQIQDLLYMSDGTWALNYDTVTTKVNQFIVSNATKIVGTAEDEYPLYRNIQLQAKSSSYITAFKVLKGGGGTENLSQFKTLRFKAIGNHRLRITILKKSITRFEDQPTYVMNLGGDLQNYAVSLNQFTSSLGNQALTLNDVSTVVFSIEIPSGTLTDVNATIADVLFSKQNFEYINTIANQRISVFPNPVSNGKFTCAFTSLVTANMVIKIVDLRSGKVVYSNLFAATKGINTVPFNLQNQLLNGIYSVNIESRSVAYKPVIVYIQP
ncbi:MAG: DUF4114 domain-containing protein [Chitinophagaceae bacterium]